MTLAPELPRSLQWLNAPATTLHEQRGRIVALAFVNGASAWCAQRLNDLAVLQDVAAVRHAQGVVGVLLDQQDGHAVVLVQLAQGLEDLLHHNRG